MSSRDLLLQLSKEELVDLLEDSAKNWLAHDGLWFLTIENEYGLDAAIKCDALAWKKFTVIEARRIMQRRGIAPGGGLPALQEALRWRLYSRVNTQEAIEVDERTLVFRMNECRVQAARKRDGRPDFPCKPVGLIEYANFARTIDPRIQTRCIACPPDEHPDEFWCAWEFRISDDQD